MMIERSSKDVEKAANHSPFIKTELEDACVNAKQTIMNTGISERQLKEMEELGNTVFSRNIWGISLLCAPVLLERMEKS